MPSQKYDAIIVGAGISGLLSALVLSKERKNVLIIEKSPWVGGNCRSYTVDGFQVDTGVHAITGLKKGPLTVLMNRYFDLLPKFHPHGHYYIHDDKKMVKFPHTVQGMARFTVFSRKDRLLMAHAFIDATKNHTTDENKLDCSVHDFIINYSLSPKAMQFIDVLSYFLSGKSMKETSVRRVLSGGGTTDESSYGVRKKLSGIIGIVNNRSFKGQGYPYGGIKSLTDAIISSIPKDRSTIKTGEGVIKIKKTKNAFITTTDKCEYLSDLVVYTAEVKNLLHILENRIPKELSESIKSLKQARSMTIWLGLKKKIKELDYLGSEIFFNTAAPFWAMPITNYDSQLAPQGKHLVGFTSIITGGRTQKKHKELLLGAIKDAFPGIEKEIVMEHTQVTLPEKAAITVGAKFPDPKTPIKGLYLAGTDVDPRSMGITRASFSVLEMIKVMKKDKIIR